MTSRQAYAASFVHNNPTTWSDPSGLKSGALSGGYSAGVCGNIQGGGGGFATVSLCLTKDDTGRRAMVLTYSSAPGVMLGWGISSTSGAFAANGRISEILGPFFVRGVSGGPPPYTGGVDVASAGDVLFAAVSGGLSYGVPLEFHGGPTNTVVVLEDPRYLDDPTLDPIWTFIDLILAVQGFP